MFATHLPGELDTSGTDCRWVAPFIIIHATSVEVLWPRRVIDFSNITDYVTPARTQHVAMPKNWRWFHRFKSEVSECHPLPAKRTEGFLRRLFSPNAVETARNKRKRWLEGLYA